MSMQISLEGQKEVPPEIRGWNWGAFLLTWIWGICNGTFLSLLCLIPGIHFIMCFVLGAKGNEWAWRNKDWESVESFQRAQRNWAAWGVGAWALAIGVLICIPLGLLGWGVSTEMPEIKAAIKDFEPQRKYCNYALNLAENDNRSNNYLGRPLQARGPAEVAYRRNGDAEISFPVRGPKGEGTLYLHTHKEGNAEVRLDHAELELRNLERLKFSPAVLQQKMVQDERKIVQLVSAVRAAREWKHREPTGHEEAEEFYRDALGQIKASPTVKEKLGSDVEAKIENAHVNFEGPVGDAEFKVNLRGNGQDALLTLKGERSMGSWVTSEAQLQVDGQTTEIPVKRIE